MLKASRWRTACVTTVQVRRSLGMFPFQEPRPSAQGRNSTAWLEEMDRIGEGAGAPAAASSDHIGFLMRAAVAVVCARAAKRPA
jgi:hypothetical protein